MCIFFHSWLANFHVYCSRSATRCFAFRALIGKADKRGDVRKRRVVEGDYGKNKEHLWNIAICWKAVVFWTILSWSNDDRHLTQNSLFLDTILLWPRRTGLRGWVTLKQIKKHKQTTIRNNKPLCKKRHAKSSDKVRSWRRCHPSSTTAATIVA